MRMEKYGLSAERLEQPRGKGMEGVPSVCGDEDEMDYSDTYESPTPAQSKPQEREDELPEDGDEGKGRRHENADEEDEEPTESEGHSRGRKRPRVKSPEAEQAEDSRTPTRSWKTTERAEVVNEEQATHQTALTAQHPLPQQQASLQLQAPTGPMPNAADAPPPYPVLPPAELCEQLIERVVQDAADSLRTKLRELVGQARGQTVQDALEQPPMSQETFDYWQHYADPTAALLEFEAAAEAALSVGPTQATSAKQEDPSAPRASAWAFPDIQYDDMEVLLAKCAPKINPQSREQPHLKDAGRAPNWYQAETATASSRTRLEKGKECQREDAHMPMEVDKLMTHRGVTSTATLDQGWALWDGEAEEVDLRQEMSQQEAEERRRENLRRRWEEANLAQPIAERVASGQPEHRRKVDQREREAALALQATRAGEIAKLGLAPPLEDGHPAVHANDPKDRAGTYVLLDVYGEGDIEDTDAQRIYDNLQAALKRITGLGKVKLEQPPRTPRAVSKEHAATTWFASGLYPAAVTLLVTVHAWPTADITFFAYKETEFIPRYLFAVKGFTQDDHDEVRLAVWDIFRKTPIYPSIFNLVKKNPDYVGMNHTQVAEELLSTIEVAIRPVNEEKHARLITHVYMTSPTRSAAMWESWRNGICYPPKGRPFLEEHLHLEVSQRITRCRACHGADHLTTQCQYGHLEGWAKVDEGASFRKQDQWRARTPRTGQAQAPVMGKGRPVFPMHLLKDKNLAEKMKSRGLRALEQLGEVERAGRTNESNPQRVLESMKSDWLRMAKEREKNIVPRLIREIEELETHLKDIQRSGAPLDRDRALEVAAVTEQLRTRKAQSFKQLQQRSRAKHRVDGEAPTRYWTRLNRPRAPREMIPAFEKEGELTPAGEKVYETDSRKMASMAKTHYDNVQKDEEGSTDLGQRDVDMEEVLNSISTELTEEQAELVGGTIGREECELALRFAKAGTAPGLDGIQYEVWKTVHARFEEDKRREGRVSFDVMRVLESAFKDVQEHGMCEGTNFAQGWVSPIWKEKHQLQEF
ncbi:hypothetical protein OH77DRAFT_1519020 [Trametes cingulata]|nr:hypothetical protein OH77DRAFT_1519020 [Trametes cingulata]